MQENTRDKFCCGSQVDVAHKGHAIVLVEVLDKAPLRFTGADGPETGLDGPAPPAFSFKILSKSKAWETKNGYDIFVDLRKNK